MGARGPGKAGLTADHPVLSGQWVSSGYPEMAGGAGATSQWSGKQVQPRRSRLIRRPADTTAEGPEQELEGWMWAAYGGCPLVGENTF